MEKRQISDMERNNKTTMCCHGIEAIVYVVTFAAELVMGARSLPYF